MPDDLKDITFQSQTRISNVIETKGYMTHLRTQKSLCTLMCALLKLLLGICNNRGVAIASLKVQFCRCLSVRICCFTGTEIV